MLHLYLNFLWAVIDYKNIDLTAGLDHVEEITLAPGDRLDITDPSLVSVKIEAKEIIFRSLSPRKGKTSVTIRDSEGQLKIAYQVNVSTNGKMNTVLKLRELLSSIEGIKVDFVGGEVMITGQVLLPDDLGKIVDIATRLDPDIINHVEYSSHALKKVAEKMTQELNQKGLREAYVRVVNKNFWIEGSVRSEEEKNLATDVVKPMLPSKIDPVPDASARHRPSSSKEVIYNFLAITKEQKQEPIPRLVRIAVQFVEMTQDYRKVFAFKWAPNLTEDTKTGFNFSTASTLEAENGLNFTGFISNLFPKLNIAKVAGYTKDIHSAMLMVKENTPASITKNLDQNFQIGSDRWAQPVKASIKFSFSTTPKILPEDQIELEALTVNMNTPTTPGVSGQPQTIDNTVTTNIIIKSKMSAVIGGMVRQSLSKQFDQDDPLTQKSGSNDQGIATSPLFNLLKSRRLDHNQSQFAVFVTPEIVPSASDGVKEIEKKFKD